MKGSSQRATAEILNCSKATVERKFQWLIKYKKTEEKLLSPDVIYIDEMQSIEHTKLKPVTIPLCVGERYEIIAIEVGRIPAKGRLAEISIRKYGYRLSERELALEKLFTQIKAKLSKDPVKIITDGAPDYPKYIQKYFPESIHEVVVSRSRKEKHRELLHTKMFKKFDPIFPLNQRCAKLRSDTKMLTRRSWCTPKKVENLLGHLKLYQSYNNSKLT